MSNITPTDPAAIDLDALRKSVERRPAFGWFQTTINNLIAAVEALRKRLAELEAQTDKHFYLHRAQKEHDRAEAAEAQLAALTTAMAQSSQHTEALERARTGEEVTLEKKRVEPQ